MTKDELIAKTDKTITELVYPKYNLQKAYNYYNGIRDANQFRYLEEAFGTSTPTTITFTPLIRKHIDALIGEYLGTPIIPKVYCKDSETIHNIERAKQLEISQKLYQFLKSHLKNTILKFVDGKNYEDPLIKNQMQEIVDGVNNSFISEYEIAAQNVIDYIMQSRDTDLQTVLRDLLLDLLVTGYTFYKTYPTQSNTGIRIKALSPLNTFIDRNIESPYVKDSNRVVVRDWLSKVQILSKYGNQMSESDKELLNNKWESLYETAMYYVKLGVNKDGLPISNGLMAGTEVTPGYPSTQQSRFNELIPVYEVEWIEVDKDNIMQRYESIRIGEEIYILKGKNEEVIRSKSCPNYCSLSVNGIYLLNRGSEPYSLVLACADQQDRYDLLHFYRDNIIANSGTVGDWIDETLIPEHLGVNFPERLSKWISLKKQGIGLLNSASEGRQVVNQAPLNTIFNGYDDTVKVQAIQAIQTAIEATEETVSSITGVFRERLNGIEARDAVTNIKIGQNNSFIITKQYNHQMDLVVNEILLDCLNLAKSVFKNGLTGTIILGDKYQKIFTALPEYFTLTDFDIRIITSSDVVRDLEQVRQLIPEFIKAGGLPPDILVEAMTCKSLPDLKYKIKKAMEIQKKENDQIAQLTQQVTKLQDELDKSTKELKAAKNQIDQINQAKLKLEMQKVQMEDKVEWYKAETERKYREAMAEEAKRRTEIEIKQLADGNPYNDTIRAIK